MDSGSSASKEPTVQEIMSCNGLSKFHGIGEVICMYIKYVHKNIPARKLRDVHCSAALLGTDARLGILILMYKYSFTQ